MLNALINRKYGKVSRPRQPSGSKKMLQAAECLKVPVRISPYLGNEMR